MIGVFGCLVSVLAVAVCLFVLWWAVASAPVPSLLFLGAFFAIAWAGMPRARRAP